MGVSLDCRRFLMNEFMNQGYKIWKPNPTKGSSILKITKEAGKHMILVLCTDGIGNWFVLKEIRNIG